MGLATSPSSPPSLCQRPVPVALEGQRLLFDVAAPPTDHLCCHLLSALCAGSQACPFVVGAAFVVFSSCFTSSEPNNHANQTFIFSPTALCLHLEVNKSVHHFSIILIMSPVQALPCVAVSIFFFFSISDNKRKFIPLIFFSEILHKRVSSLFSLVSVIHSQKCATFRPAPIVLVPPRGHRQ